MLKVLRPSPSLRPWIVVLSVAGATILPTYLSGALTVALPTIGPQIGLAAADLQWPLTVFSLVNGAFLIVSGGLADGIGRKYAFLVGAAWILIFSIPLAVINISSAFIAMSAVLGFGLALLAPAGTGILSQSLPDGPFKNASFAALGAGQPFGFTFGLIIGGIFAHQKYVIYIIAAAGAGLFSLLALISLPRDDEQLQVKGVTASSDNSLNERENNDPRATSVLMAFDWIGAALSTIGIILFTLGLAFASSQQGGWKSIPVLLCLCISIVLMTLFFFWESQKQKQSSGYAEGEVSRTLKAPLIPPGLWRAPRFLPTLSAVFFAWMSFNALTYFCTLTYQEIQHLSPIQTSIRFLPMVGSGLLLNVAGGILVAKVNASWLFLVGALGGAASCLLYALLDPTWPYAQGLLVVMILTVFPDCFFPAGQLFACQSAGPKRAALAGSLFNVTVRLATSTGLAITSSIANTVTKQSSPLLHPSERLLVGYRAAGWFCFACSILSAILSVVFLRKVGIVGARKREESNQEERNESEIQLVDLEHSIQAPRLSYKRQDTNGKISQHHYQHRRRDSGAIINAI